MEKCELKNGNLSKLIAFPWHFFTIKIPTQGTTSSNFLFQSSSTNEKFLVELLRFYGRNQFVVTVKNECEHRGEPKLNSFMDC